MTTVELLAYCRAQKPQPCVPDLVWQREAHHDENIRLLRGKDADYLAPNGFHGMYDTILETRSWLVATKRTYATVLFTEGAACSEPRK